MSEFDTCPKIPIILSKAIIYYTKRGIFCGGPTIPLFYLLLFNDFFLSGCFSTPVMELRLERTLIKKQTVCQKEIIRMHDIISAKTTVFNKLPCHDSHKESYSVTDTKTNIIYSGSIKRINS